MTVISLGKRIVPVSMKPFATRAYRWGRLRNKALRTTILSWIKTRLFLTTRVGRALLYRVFSNEFSREHLAVAAGQKAYLDERQNDTRSLYLLRRNIHRIEKGLIAEAQRDTFALEYIEETVDEFAVYSNLLSTTADCDQFIWAHNVLANYFETASHKDPRVRRAETRFLETGTRVDAISRKNVPFLRDLDDVPVTIDAFSQLSKKRKSVRSYLPQLVDRTYVDRALETARFAPSACNRQAFTFRIFDDPAQAREVGALPMGTKSFVHNLNAIVVVVGHLRAYPFARDRHAMYIDASLATMAFVYGLEAQGIGSCIINWADEAQPENAAMKLLNLQSDERVLMMISYGWPKPDEKVPFSAKRPVQDMRIFEEGFN